jgi:hypothetical protein
MTSLRGRLFTVAVSESPCLKLELWRRVAWHFSDIKMKRMGKSFETFAREFLANEFHTTMIFKLINTERMDFIVVRPDHSIVLVEAKKTSKQVYFTKSSPRKRAQLNRYFDYVKALHNEYGSCTFCLLASLRGRIYFKQHDSIDDIPTAIRYKDLK